DSDTVTTTWSVNAPSSVVTVIVAVPSSIPVTSPLALTTATSVSSEAQVTTWFVGAGSVGVGFDFAQPPGCGYLLWWYQFLRDFGSAQPLEKLMPAHRFTASPLTSNPKLLCVSFSFKF